MNSNRLSVSILSLALVFVVSSVSPGQILSDGEFQAVNFTSSTPTVSSGTPITALSDIRFNIDYSNIDVFGNGFTVVNLPEAPNSDPNDTSTTGVFLSANNDSNTPFGTASFASISPLGLLVGEGTATPNYRMSVDIFHSTGTGLLDPNGQLISQSGTTNYSLLGLNQTNPIVQVEDLNAPGGGENLAGQGLGLAITADGGAAEDYMPVYGGALYRDRGGNSDLGEAYRGVPDPNTGSVVAYGNVGLAGTLINRLWLDQGLGFEIDDPTISPPDPNNPLRLNRFTGNSQFFSPDPNNLAGYDLDDPNIVAISPYADTLIEATGVPTHLSGDFQTLEGTLRPNEDGVREGVVSNRWATHNLYWIDGQFTYVIDGVPVLQFTPDNDGLNGDDNVYDDFSDSGSVVLGFFDRFSSIAISPEGANFVVYDNLVVEAAASGDAPNLLGFYKNQGFLPDSAIVPEPAAASLLILGGGWVVLGGRRLRSLK